MPFEVYNTWRAAEPQRLSAMHKARARAMTTPRPPARTSPVASPWRTRFVQFRLGQAHEFGEGNVAIDLEVARSCYQDPAEVGDLDAQCRLGFAYVYGSLGLKIDFDMALMWFKKAAEGGHIISQWQLGVAYLWGSKVWPKNHVFGLSGFELIATKASGGSLDASLKAGCAGPTLSFRELDEHKQQRFKVEAIILAPKLSLAVFCTAHAMGPSRPAAAPQSCRTLREAPTSMLVKIRRHHVDKIQRCGTL